MPNWLHLLFCFGLALFSAQTWAKDPSVWVVLSRDEGAYAEAGQVIGQRLGADSVLIRPWQQFNQASLPAPKVIVAVGQESLNRVAEGNAWPKVPVIGVLVSRGSLDKLAEQLGRGRVSGVYLDQPFDRQMALLRMAMPDKDRIGVLLGPDSREYFASLKAAAQRAGLKTIIRQVDAPDRLSDAMQTVFAEADVLLAIPDPMVYNSQTAQYVLLGTYRRRMPMLAFSASFVRAGALLALYSTPEQVAAQAVDLVAAALSGGSLPPPQFPQAFEVNVNASVARSLDLRIDADALRQRLERRSP